MASNPWLASPQRKARSHGSRRSRPLADISNHQQTAQTVDDMSAARRWGASTATVALVAVLLIAAIIAVASEADGLVAALRAHGVLIARDTVIDAMVRTLPSGLPAGTVAVLDPGLPSPSLLAPEVAPTWTSQVTTRLQQQRPDLSIASRDHLEAILREQRFANSAYAASDGKIRVGRLLTATMLLLTEVEEFRFVGPVVRITMKAQLLDVETGSVIWSHSRAGGIFPPWPRPAGFILAALIVSGGGCTAFKQVRARTTRRAVSSWAAIRQQIDSLAGAATSVRNRYLRENLADVAHRQESAWRELDGALDLLRRSPPPRRAARATESVRDLASTIRALHAACEDPLTNRDAGLALAHELRAGVGAVRMIASRISPLRENQ